MSYPPDADAPTPTTQPPRSKRLLLWIALAAVIVLAALAGGAYYLWGRGPTLASANKECNIGVPGMRLADGDQTLVIDTINEAGAGGVPEFSLVCVLNHLEAPTAVREHMSSTRALDGRQTDSWGDFTAAWTYHPNDGVDLVIQER